MPLDIWDKLAYYHAAIPTCPLYAETRELPAVVSVLLRNVLRLLLVDAVKELEAENDAKEDRITGLQAQVDQLTAEMQAVLARLGSEDSDELASSK